MPENQYMCLAICLNGYIQQAPWQLVGTHQPHHSFWIAGLLFVLCFFSSGFDFLFNIHLFIHKHLPNAYYMAGTTQIHVRWVDLFLKQPSEVGATVKCKETASQINHLSKVTN